MTRCRSRPRLPYAAEWRKERSPTASTGAVASRGKVPTARPARDAHRRERSGRGRFKAPGRQPAPKRERNWGRWLGIGWPRSSSSSLVWGVASYLSVPERRRGREQAAPAIGEGRARAAERADALEPERDPAARHRPLRRSGDAQTASSTPTRSCCSAPTRASDRLALPLDPARPAGRRSPATATTRSTPRSRSAGRRSRSRPCAASPGVEVNHVVDRRLRRLHEGDRQGRRRRRQRPEPILSNKFDCPYATQARCDRWQGWRFAKGMQHMNGQRALVYSRIRENKLEPARERPDPRRAPAGRDRRRCSRS